MLRQIQKKPRRAAAGALQSAGRREYRFAPAEELHTFCLEAAGVSRGEVWAVGVDYFRFCLYNGNTVCVGTALDRLRDRYAFALPVEPEELTAVEVRLGYLRDGECRRTFRTITLPLAQLARRREGRCTVLRPVWRAYLDDSAPGPQPLAPEEGPTPCETCYYDGLF